MYINFFFFQRSHNFKNWQFKKKALRSHPPYLLLACKTFTNRTTIFIKPYTVKEKSEPYPVRSIPYAYKLVPVGMATGDRFTLREMSLRKQK